MDLEVGIEERPEETEALEVIEVKVTQEDVQFSALNTLQGHTEWPYTGARVENQDLTTGKPNLDARGISAVLQSVRARRSD